MLQISLHDIANQHVRPDSDAMSVPLKKHGTTIRYIHLKYYLTVVK